MFGSVRLKNVFRTAVKKDCSVKFVDIACHASINVVVNGSFIYLVQDNTIQVILKLPSDITSCCATDLKAESLLNTGGLFCSTSNGKIFAVQLGSYLSQVAANSHSGKPLLVEIQDDSIVYELPDVLAIKSVESRLVVLFKSADTFSVASLSTSECSLIPPEPRMHHLYMCKESTATNVVPLLQFAVVISASFHQKSPNQCGQSANVLTVSDELFNAMFGFELNLCRSPVLLFRGLSGLVLWLPVKSVASSSASVQVLCSLGDSFVHAVTFCSVPNDDTLSSSYLALIGHRGHILVISVNSSATMLSYQHYDILGPVHCCILLDNSKLLYSTGNELYVASLAESVCSGQSGSIKSTAAGVSGVTALSGVSSSEKNNGKTVVLAALYDGRIVELEIDSNVADDSSTRLSHVAAVQNAISNLLSNISQTDECLRRVKQDLEAKDVILEQLAIAGSLQNRHSVSPIHCSIVASIDDSSSPCRRMLRASISNGGDFTLGRNWTFLLSLTPSSKCCKDNVDDESCCKSCSTDSHCLYTLCGISGLKPGQSESLSLSISQDGLSSDAVSHTVTTALLYTPQNQTGSEVKQISIPLVTQVIDILDFVQLESSAAKCRRSGESSSFASEFRRLQQLCRPQWRNNIDSDCMSVDELSCMKKTVASVKEHVLSLYASKPSNVQDVTANKLLSLLLGEIAADVGSTVSLVSPEGQTFSIEVLPSADDEYQLILRGCDLHTLIAVRLALLHRLETKAQCRVVPKLASDASIQHLRSELDDVRDSVSFGASKLTAAKRVVELYETLRSPVP